MFHHVDRSLRVLVASVCGHCFWVVSVTNDATINTFGVTENNSRSKIIRPRGTNVFMAPDTNAKLPAIKPEPFVFRGGLQASSRSRTAFHVALLSYSWCVFSPRENGYYGLNLYQIHSSSLRPSANSEVKNRTQVFLITKLILLKTMPYFFYDHF